MATQYGSHDRVMNGRLITVSTARKWTAEDYNLIEELIARGLRYHEMVPHFTDPPVTADNLERACQKAKIDYPYKAGRPRKRA